MNSQRKAWAVMLAAYLAGVAVALNQSKVPPVMQVLMQNLQMDTVTGGWLMSAFAVAGIILGLPAALVLGKLGPKHAGLVALGCTLLGSVVGALAAAPAMLLIGRAIEGIGLGLMAVIAPAIISLWFPPEKRGTPMGVWASWVPVGSFIIYNLAAPLTNAFGWQSIWWFGALFALIALVVYTLIVSAPPAIASANDQPRGDEGSFGKMLLNPASWLLALVFGAFNFAFMGFATWGPSYFNQGLGLSLETASFYASLGSLVAIPATIIAGRILDRVQNRYRVMTLSLGVSGVVLFWCFQLGSAEAIIPYTIVLTLASGFVPTAVFTLAPETMPDPKYAGLALGMISVGQNLGLFFGPPIVGGLIAGGNWAAGVIPIVSAMAVGVLIAIGLQIKRRPQAALLETQ